jgi:RNA polymerase sigma-70 factor (ECF subfamily)
LADRANPTDEQLAAAAAGGDRRALELLLDRHADRVHAVCRRVVVHPEDALDATQEALVAIARGIGRFDGRSRFTTWLHRVATNAALDELRRKKRRPVTGFATDVADEGGERAPTGRASRPAAGEPMETDAIDVRLDVDAALLEVPDEFRAAVVLRDLADLDYSEIAEVLAVPLGTVKSRVARGRAALRAALGNPAPASGRPRGQP